MDSDGEWVDVTCLGDTCRKYIWVPAAPAVGCEPLESRYRQEVEMPDGDRVMIHGSSPADVKARIARLR